MSSNQISEQVAKDQINVFMEYYELEDDMIIDQARVGYEAAVKRIIKNIQRGRLEIKNDDGCKLIQTLRNPSGAIQTITYGVLKGSAKVAMKSKLETDANGKVYALLGSISGLGEMAIQSLEGPDLSLAECIGCLFLQV